MQDRNVLAVAALAALLSSACDPYAGFGQGYGALGAVDPVNFPAENLGEGGNRKNPGSGIFLEVQAYVHGAPVGYFPYTTRGAKDPTVLEESSAPKAYAFLPGCLPPAGYQYDYRQGDIPYDQQGSIFTELPTASYREGVASSSSYLPIVAEAVLDPGGLNCQEFTSEDGIKALWRLASANEVPLSGRYLAWLIIEPSSSVLPFNALENDPGVGLQSWGWYNRYLLAYLDGGELPVVMVPGDASNPATTKIVTQKIYYPRSFIYDDTDPMAAMNPVAAAKPGELGQGYDVLEGVRGQPGYSPLCEVWTYEMPSGPNMPTPISALPKSADQVLPFAPQKDEATGYIYCLQAPRRPAAETVSDLATEGSP